MTPTIQLYSELADAISKGQKDHPQSAAMTYVRITNQSGDQFFAPFTVTKMPGENPHTLIDVTLPNNAIPSA